MEPTQETSSQDMRHVTFQKAILLDMLLGSIANDFVPYQRHLDDGLAVQLEILEALEKAQNDAAAKLTAQTSSSPTTDSGEYLTMPRTSSANKISGSKRDLMADRLKNKKTKLKL
jgi:hypothetical protein